MQTADLERLAAIRVAVGYLGEKEQCAWWPSSFFAKASPAFAAPLFPRTQLLAQSKGVTSAASRVHDDRIGVGHVYHLFRLPEDMEQAVHRLLHEPDAVERVKAVISTKDDALQSLKDNNGSSNENHVGPTRIGDLKSLRTISGWQNAAAAYIDGFESDTEVFPYFADTK